MVLRFCSLTVAVSVHLHVCREIDLFLQHQHTHIPALTRCHYRIVSKSPKYHTNTQRPYPYYPLTLGDFLRKRRLDLSLTRTQVAIEIGTYNSNIRNWEANRLGVSLRFRKRVHEFVGICPYDPVGTKSRSRTE